MDATLIAYVAAAALLTITPGIDTALVLRTTLSEGRQEAAWAGVGIALGCLLWGLATSVGLGVIFEASALAYTGVKWAGAAYLAYLGVRLLFGGSAGTNRLTSDADAARRGRSFRRGLLANLLNPKVGVFYVSFLPQFIPDGANIPAYSAMLTAIHAGLGLMWFALLIVLTTSIGGFLRAPKITLWIDRVTGVLFLAFAVRLALDRR